MKKDNKKSFFISACMLVSFVFWTAAVRFIDVQTIGPQESAVGFASINRFVHRITGVHMSLYIITDWLGLIPFCFVIVFACLGLIQWIRRKNLTEVDHSILILGGFYIAVVAAYIFFETAVVNYRPVLIDGHLEPSYPSSTTMLVMCVIPTAMMQFKSRIKSHFLKQCIVFSGTAFTVFMVVGRLISGVHWITDIIGGALFSTGLVMMYHSIISLHSK